MGVNINEKLDIIVISCGSHGGVKGVKMKGNLKFLHITQFWSYHGVL